MRGLFFKKTNGNFLNKDHHEDVVQVFKFYRTAIEKTHYEASGKRRARAKSL